MIRINADDEFIRFALFVFAVSLNRVALRGNTADFYGAIVLRGGNHQFINSSITGNSAGNCIAVGNETSAANLYMSNVTISGNFDRDGADTGGLGAVCNNGGNLTIRNSTIAYNEAFGSGGGLWNGAMGNINIGNTIVARNQAGNSAPDIRIVNGTITSVGGNLVEDLNTVPANTFNQPNDITGVNPRLAPTNSGQGGHPVMTHPLQAGSPAINAGRNVNAVDALTNTPLTTDARGVGFPRIVGGTVDKGAFEDQSNSATLVVSKLGNSNDGVCDIDCSLREAVFAASQDPGTDNITMAANVFGTMTLGGSEIGIINNNDVNIFGYPGLDASTLIISGGGTNRLFSIASNANVTMTGLTLANGNGAGTINTGQGGAVITTFGGTLSLDRVVVRNNTANRYGAIYMQDGVHRMVNTTIHNNSSVEFCSAVGVEAGSLRMANTTISTNFDTQGTTGLGALCADQATLTIRNSTIANNRTTSGPGAGISTNDSLNIGNTIVAQNLAASNPDINVYAQGSITSVGGNLVQNTSGFPAGSFSQLNDQTGIDPLLGPLADNGGSVTTIALLSGSPAINTGINSNAVDPFDNSVLVYDARGVGFNRILGGLVDKGAFESAGTTAAEVTLSGKVMTTQGGALRNARVILTDQQGITRSVITNTFGFYTFEEVPAGETYIVSVNSKRYRFAARILIMTDSISEFDFTGQE
ncbi:hypothetical protein BH20ACI2_BH20ACI2_24850 [soil metagenome]